MVALNPTKRIVETETGMLGKMKLSPTIPVEVSTIPHDGQPSIVFLLHFGLR